MAPCATALAQQIIIFPGLTLVNLFLIVLLILIFLFCPPRRVTAFAFCASDGLRSNPLSGLPHVGYRVAGLLGVIFAPRVSDESYAAGAAIGSGRFMQGLAARLLPYILAFFSSLCIMTIELDSSRLVAQHVGASLMVWTSVIGIILGGICLGNVLGGRLADRVDPRRAVGPLFALGSFLTVSTLWMNAVVGFIIPSPFTINWELRTVLVIALDFLVPATVLGMVGPVVAKIAVENARKAGSAIGDVYFWGAVGSIVGTFLTGFVLFYLAPSSMIIQVVAAALAVLAAALFGETVGLATAVLAAVLLGLGSINPLARLLGLGSIRLGSYPINYLSLAGHAAACALAPSARRGSWLRRARRTSRRAAKGLEAGSSGDPRRWNSSRACRPGCAGLRGQSRVHGL